MTPRKIRVVPQPAIVPSDMNHAQDLTPPEAPGRRMSRGTFSAGPVLGLVAGTVTAVVAAAAALMDWYPEPMLIVVVSLSAAVSMLAIVLLYRQRGGRWDIAERVRAEESLARSEARLRGILDSAMDAIITVDEHQHIVMFNVAAEAVFGYPREDAIGAPLARFIPERFRAGHADHIRRFGEEGTNSRRMGMQRIVTGLRRNGEEFPIDASISQITEHGRKFYTVILRDVTRQVQAEQALRQSKEELHELAAAANQLREHEKRRVARELHDDLAQALTGVKMDVAWLKQQLAAPPRSLSDKLNDMEALLDGAVAATRRISSDLRPMMLDDLGLVPATEWLVQSFSERTGIPCRFALANPELELRDPHATTVFRIVQEALTNVTKHARASHVEVTLEERNGELVVRVRDDGVGFSLQDSRKPHSYGLVGLRERAYLLGGQVEIESGPGAGTRIEARLPLPTDTP